jgi:hypothetical protein
MTAICSLANEGDPLILQAGATWHLVRPFDEWLLVVEDLTEDDLMRLPLWCRVGQA